MGSIGWSTSELPSAPTYTNEHVGGGDHSYGFNRYRAIKSHNNGEAQWGKSVQRGSVVVVGVALDMVKGEILYSMDGKWTAPMGVAFDAIDTNTQFFPAVTGHNCTLCANFGERDFTYGPPDASFQNLRDAV